MHCLAWDDQIISQIYKLLLQLKKPILLTEDLGSFSPENNFAKTYSVNNVNEGWIMLLLGDK